MERGSREVLLDGWTKAEKLKLLKALRKVGINDIKKIKELLDSKTEDEIRAALVKYIDVCKKKALTCKVERRKRKSNPMLTPLANWTKIIIDTHGTNSIHTETSTALRLFAEHEDGPDVTKTREIDLKKVYHAFADALKGKPIPKDKHIRSVLRTCLVETALTSEKIDQCSCARCIVPVCNPTSSKSGSSKQVEHPGIKAIRDLAASTTYNPLNISVAYLILSYGEEEE